MSHPTQGEPAPATRQGKTTDAGRHAKKAKKGHHWDVNGLIDTDLEQENPSSSLLREELVNKSMSMAREGRFLVVSSPPGTGKSSLLQLVKRKLSKENIENNGQTRGYSLRPSTRDAPDFNLYDFVKERTGVSYKDSTVGGQLNNCSEVWILVDDAQRLYGEKHKTFWEDAVKEKAKGAFGERTKVIVVVAATYYLSNVGDSPVAFMHEPRINLEAMLLSRTEAKDLFNRRCMCPTWSNYFERLFYTTNGAAAAFTLGLNIIYQLSRKLTGKVGTRLWTKMLLCKSCWKAKHTCHVTAKAMLSRGNERGRCRRPSCHL